MTTEAFIFFLFMVAISLGVSFGMGGGLQRRRIRRHAGDTAADVLLVVGPMLIAVMIGLMSR